MQSSALIVAPSTIGKEGKLPKGAFEPLVCFQISILMPKQAMKLVLILSIPQLVGKQGLSGIHPGGVNMRVSNEQCADRVAGGR